jgi:hypothetical protein
MYSQWPLRTCTCLPTSLTSLSLCSLRRSSSNQYAHAYAQNTDIHYQDFCDGKMSTLKVTIDAYATLGVAHDASIPEINASYKRLALKLHPDHAGNTEAANEKFRQVCLQQKGIFSG